MFQKTIILLFISAFVSAQTPITTDTLMYAHSIKTKTQLICDSLGQNCKPMLIFHYDRLGKLLQKESYSGDTLKETNFYIYNGRNYVSEVFSQYENGKKFLNIKYIYDKKGNLISQITCYPGGNCEPFEKYRYRADQKLLSRTRYKEGKYFYEYQHKYDKLGRNTEVLILSNDSDSGERELKTYNSKNQHTASRWIDYHGEEIDHANYTYDDKGNLIKNEWIGGLSTAKLYEYDSLGNQTKYTSIDYTGEVDDQRTTTYHDSLISSRIQTDGKKINHYIKYIYEKW